jgi:hypothetical protein
MSHGREAFNENCEMVGAPMNDAQTWNLNAGLEQFAQGVQSDVRRLEQKLDQILTLLRSMQ